MNEPLRKAVHLIFGLAIACFILFSERRLALYALVIALFLGFILSDALSRGYTIPMVSTIVATLERRDVFPGKGALFFALGALFSLTFFPKEVTFIGLVVLALLDSVTTLVGLRFGRTRIYNHKSIEATLAGFAATTAALLFLIPTHAAILTSAAAAFAELVSRGRQPDRAGRRLHHPHGAVLGTLRPEPPCLRISAGVGVVAAIRTGGEDTTG